MGVKLLAPRVARSPQNGQEPTDGRGGTDPRRTVPARPNVQVAARVGLWGLVALGAIGGCVGLLRPAGQSTAPDAASDATGTVPPEMAGFAELAVTTWVESTGENSDEAVDPLFVDDPSTNGSDVGQRRVRGNTAVVDARRVEDGYWAVTVATPVDEQVDGTWTSAGTWYLEVGVVESGGRSVAVAEPAVVPAPTEPESAPGPAAGGMGVPAQEDEDMATTVQGFLSALVAGDGDVSRYLAPDVVVRPVTPAPFAQVDLQRWAVTEDGDGEARVRVSARGASANGVPRTVSYELGLAERAGRWEVTSLSGAPTLDATGTGDDDRAGGDAGVGDDAPSSPSTTVPAATTTVPVASEPGA